MRAILKPRIAQYLYRSISTRHDKPYKQHDIEIIKDSAIKTAPDDLQQYVSEHVTMDPFSFVKPNSQEQYFIDSLAPPMKVGYNFAAYINRNDTLKSLVNLGVSLFDIENVHGPQANYLLLLDFEADCLNHIKFLIDNGVKLSNIGRFLTQHPLIFKETIENLQIKLNYLAAKGFRKEAIAEILNKNAMILNEHTTKLDYRIDQLKIEFGITMHHIWKIVTSHPDILLYGRDHYRLLRFCLADEFGFTSEEMINIITKNPTLFDYARPVLIRKLDLLHNIIGLSHELLALQPEVISAPKIDLMHRFGYLKKLNKIQFDRTKPLFIPPIAFYGCNIEDFCEKYAKTSVENYNKYLKTI